LGGGGIEGGRGRLLDRLAACRPRVACYNGKGVYGALSGRKQVEYGRQPTALIPGVVDFVAASPSGRSRETVQVKLGLYQALKRLIT